MKKRDQRIILGILILLLITINYSFIDSFLIKIFNSRDRVLVIEVIDGDTLKINGTSIRLLGINTPEKGEVYYSEAKEFLKQLVLNQTVELEYGKEKYDKYGRTLAYIFLNNENINLKLVRGGFANFYFPSGRDRYYPVFKKEWEECIQSNTNLCEKSSDRCSNCILIKELNSKDKLLILENSCSFECDLNNWIIKAEGRQTLELNFTLNSLQEKFIEFDSLGNQEENTLFLRDNESKLVLWKEFN